MSITQTALITGGAKRIGRTIALALATDGYHIALHYNDSEDEAKATQADIQKLGVTCEIFQADLANHADAVSLIERAHEAMGGLSLLVHNASIFEQHSFLETSEEAFDAHMAINFKAPFFMTQTFSKLAKNDKSNGQVISILDSYMTKTTGVYFPYLLSKKALHDFTKMAARDLGPDIRVNGVALGITELSQHLTERKEQGIVDTLPMRSHVMLDDVVDAVRYLVRSQRVTGDVLFVDGGHQLV